jgi:paraquat-inducible protein A
MADLDPPQPNPDDADRPVQRTVGHYIVLAGMIMAWSLLIWSYLVPTVTFQRFAKMPETFSIWQGVERFWRGGNEVLALIVFVFSMIFPVAKLLALCTLWFKFQHSKKRESAFVWLEFLGKWSMLDVLIIAMFVGALRMGPQIGDQVLSLAEGRSEVGIDLYGAAIVLSMLCTMGLARLEKERHEPRPASQHPLDRIVALAFAVMLIATLWLPVFSVGSEVPYIGRVESEFRLLSTVPKMVSWNQWTMAIALGVWVIGSPILRAILGLWVRFRPSGPRVMRLTMGLDEWAMLDVFALCAVMVQVKLGDLADCDLLIGFWMCLIAGVLGILDSILLRTRRAAP